MEFVRNVLGFLVEFVKYSYQAVVVDRDFVLLGVDLDFDHVHFRVSDLKFRDNFFSIFPQNLQSGSICPESGLFIRTKKLYLIVSCVDQDLVENLVQSRDESRFSVDNLLRFGVEDPHFLGVGHDGTLIKTLKIRNQYVQLKLVNKPALRTEFLA